MNLCRICRIRCDGKHCSPECERTDRQIAEAHTAAPRRKRKVTASTDDDARVYDSDLPDPPEPTVLYGLLTFADAAELARRRRKLTG